MTEGVIRKINIPIFKMMFEASLEQFFQRDILERNKISYQDALQEVVDILVDGPFIEEQKNLALKFRGSENQRLIDMNEYRRSGNIVTILGS